MTPIVVEPAARMKRPTITAPSRGCSPLPSDTWAQCTPYDAIPTCQRGQSPCLFSWGLRRRNTSQSRSSCEGIVCVDRGEQSKRRRLGSSRPGTPSALLNQGPMATSFSGARKETHSRLLSVCAPLSHEEELHLPLSMALFAPAYRTTDVLFVQRTPLSCDALYQPIALHSQRHSFRL